MASIWECIVKTLDRKRGYKIGYSWQTVYEETEDGTIFKIYHHGNDIISVNLTKKKILEDCTGCSGDHFYANKALYELKKRGLFEEKNVYFEIGRASCRERV